MSAAASGGASTAAISVLLTVHKSGRERKLALKLSVLPTSQDEFVLRLLDRAGLSSTVDSDGMPTVHVWHEQFSDWVELDPESYLDLATAPRVRFVYDDVSGVPIPTAWRLSPAFLKQPGWVTKGGSNAYRSFVIKDATGIRDPAAYNQVLQEFGQVLRGLQLVELYAVDSDHHNTAFAGQYHKLKSCLERNPGVFNKKTWQQKGTAEQIDWRRAVHDQLQQRVNQFGFNDGCAAKLLPVAHATGTVDVAWSICRLGFVKHLAQTDAGYFGKGLYASQHGRYSAECYGLNLVLGWAVVGNTYPCVEDPMAKDGSALLGLAQKSGHDSHYAVVRPLDWSAPGCKVFVPCKPGEFNKARVYDEVVLFEESQLVPRYVAIVKLDASPKATLTPVSTPVQQLPPTPAGSVPISTIAAPVQLLSLAPLAQAPTIVKPAPAVSSVALASSLSVQPSSSQAVGAAVNVDTIRKRTEAKAMDSIYCMIEWRVGEEFVCGSNDGTLSLWNKDGQCLRVLKGHKDTVRCVVPWRGGLLSCSDDGTIRQWDSSLRCVAVHGPNSFWRLIASPDPLMSLVVWGDVVASCSDLVNTVKLWSDDFSFSRTLKGHTDSVKRLVEWPQGFLATGSDDETVRVWSKDGGCVQVLSGHTGPVRCLAVWKQRLCSSSWDSTVRVWSAADFTCLFTITGTATCMVEWQHLLVTGASNGTICIWDECVRTIAIAPNRAVTAACALGRRFVTASCEQLIVWEADFD
eukprot:TRINITY_DN3097_c2_g1_i1.p1 TRINITY_DN3097_c2_g1~~TRINITY_DN3097_c2_g1_i1.p1  ORF type:complete len:744 (+),score=135.07 TRINITY_DN3097_c2_g1_i1:205-2436(+)